MAKLIVGVNDLKTLRPDLVKEWDYEKNNELEIYPDKVTCGSGKKVWWKCNKGHLWQSSIYSRTEKGKHGCPYCSNQKVLKGYNDLETVHPELLKDWDYAKNNELGIYPDNVTCGSGKKAWWKCSICGNSWLSVIDSRCKGHGCSYCLNQKVLKGYNDLETVYPELLEDWDYAKNNELGIYPDNVTYGSEKKVWWKCPICGHEWKAKISHRSNGHGCWVCSRKKIGSIKSMPADGESLKDKYPKLLEEWDYEKNNKLGIYPDEVACSSRKKVWWKCDKGHSWQAVINSRFRGTGCPYCSNKKIIVGYNDLATLNPNLAKEWHPTKNGELTPEMVTCHSGQKVWWQCKKGHEWKTTVSDRSEGHNCPICNISSTSYSEQAVFYHIKSYYPDALNRYRFNDNNGSFEVDIYIPNIKIAIEYDGEYWHKDRKDIDLLKEKRLKKLKIKLFRILEFTENLINGNYIYYDFHHNRFNNFLWAIKELLLKLDCGNLFVDINNDNNKILEMFYSNELENSLAVVNPELSKEWNREKNGNLDPKQFRPYSNQKVWWKCNKCGYEWITAIFHRSNGTGCPVCAGLKVLKGFNDLESQYQDLAKEWNYEKNESVPSNFVCGSNQKVWWKCSTCEHEWLARISSRVKGTGCPVCAKKKQKKNK